MTKHKKKRHQHRPGAYVHMLSDDKQLRKNVQAAYAAAYDAYRRISEGKDSSKILVEDKKVHRDLKQVAEALRETGMALKEGPKKRHNHRLRKFVTLTVVGAILAMVFSEDFRNKVLDAMFGKEEEFEYPSTAPANNLNGDETQPTE